MKATILYESDEKAVSSERFLSKQELVKIFGAGTEVSRIITYRKQRFKRHKSFTKHSNTSKDERYMKANYPVFRQKSRMIEL